MGKKGFNLVILVAICVSSIAMGQSVDQSTYTGPARAALFTGTLSGLSEAYGILHDGMNDGQVTGDKRELILLYVLARTGMLVFDRQDVAFNTSLVEILEPFGVTIAGDKFFSHDPNDPDRVQVYLPIDPNDGYQVPLNADPVAAANAVNNAILPEIDALLAQLAQVTDSPTKFKMVLMPAETGLDADIEVDYGDVLLVRAALLGAKAWLHSVANPGYNIDIDLVGDPLFAGWERGILPESTTVNAVLNAYPNLLKVLQPAGPARLAEAKQNLIAFLDAVNTALDYKEDNFPDDPDTALLSVDKDDPDYVAVRDEVNKFLVSLKDGTAADYTAASKQTYTLNYEADSIGQMALIYGPFGVNNNGWISLSEPGTLPAWWDIRWFRISGDRIEGDAEGATDTGDYWGWFWGTISADGAQITSMVFEFEGWDWGSGWLEGSVTNLSAQRTSTETTTVKINPNPLFAGTVGPRDMFPLFDAMGCPSRVPLDIAWAMTPRWAESSPR
jgi:hypothetical protein